MNRPSRRTVLAGAAGLAGATALTAGPGWTQGNPIRIGYGMALSGPLAANGKSALLAQQIWEEEVNAKGGLLGRPVKLIHYDDQSNPSTVPGIYTKLLDVDKVDLVISGYATNMIAPAMPIMMQKQKLFISLLGLAVNSEFKYDRYFSMIPSGPDTKAEFTKGFFEVASQQNPKPKTIAIAAEDAEFSRNGAEGARQNAKKAGFKIVYDKTYPPATTDYAPIVRAIAATNPDMVVICSYPLSSVGMVRAINEQGFKPKMLGGGMVGLQSTAIKTQLGPLLNGIVNYDFWLPVPKMNFPGVEAMLKKYQAKAASAGVDPLGYYMAPFGYAQMQVLQQAIEGTKSIDDGKLAAYMHANAFKTVAGDIRFGKGGEWTKGRVVQVQFHGIKDNSVGPFKDLSAMTVVAPAEYASGKAIYPYADAKK
jgi:branched-chain amino acid transport system substrate-binding protein